MGRDKASEVCLWHDVVRLKDHTDALLQKIDKDFPIVSDDIFEVFVKRMAVVGHYFALLSKFSTRFRFDIGPEMGKAAILSLLQSVRSGFYEILNKHIDDMEKEKRVNVRNTLNLDSF